MAYIYATAIFSRGVVGDLGGVGNGQRVRVGIALEKHTAALSRFVVGNFRRAGNSKIAVVKAHAATVIRCGVAGNFATRNLNSDAHRLHTAAIALCGVVGDTAAGHGKAATYATAVTRCGVTADLAVGHGKRALVVHTAATITLCGGVVVDDTAAGHGKFAAVVHTATKVRAIVADLAVVHGECAVVTHTAAPISARLICGNASAIHRKGAAISNFNAAFIAGDTAAVHGKLAASGIFLFDFHSSTFVAISYDLGNSPGVLAVAEDKIAALNVDSPVTAIMLHLDAVAIQAEVEGLTFRNGQGISTLQSHIVGEIVVTVGKLYAIFFFVHIRAVPGLPGDIVARAGVVANVLVRSAADGVVGMRSRRARRVGPHAGRAQQGTQAQRYTYDPFLPRHFVTRSSPRFISLRRAEGCGVYTPVVCGCGGWVDRVVRPYGGCKGVRPLLTGRGEFPYNGIILRSPVNEARALGGKKYGG